MPVILGQILGLQFFAALTWGQVGNKDGICQLPTWIQRPGNLFTSWWQVAARPARAVVGPQDKQVIRHYGPPTLLTVAQWPDVLSRFRAPKPVRAPGILPPPPAPLPPLAGLELQYGSWRKLSIKINKFGQYLVVSLPITLSLHKI